MSYTVKVIDNDNGNVLLDSNRVMILLGSFVERVDELRCTCNMGVFVSGSRPAIASACDALEQIICDIEDRFPEIKDRDKLLSGIAFDSEEELNAALSAPEVQSE